MRIDDLIAAPHDGFVYSHGMGCYPMDETRPAGECEWRVSLASDRAIPGRRRVVVTRDHVRGSGTWADVFVFACRSGRLETLFRDGFESGVGILDAPADTLTISGPGWDAADAHCCPSRGNRLTYAWDEKLPGYVLRSLVARSSRRAR